MQVGVNNITGNFAHNEGNSITTVFDDNITQVQFGNTLHLSLDEVIPLRSGTGQPADGRGDLRCTIRWILFLRREQHRTPQPCAPAPAASPAVGRMAQ